MTDQDRGAYMPHAEAPLAFDARRPSDRRPLPMTLIASAGVLALIVGALAMAYRGGVRGSEEPRPVGEPIGAIKTAAAPEAASDTASEKLDVYAAQNVPSRPSFVPPPEAPKARPAAAIAAPAQAAPAQAAPATTAPTGLQVRAVDPAKLRIAEPEAITAPAPQPNSNRPTASEKAAAASSRTAVTPGAADRPAPKPVIVAAAAAPAAPAVASTKAAKLDTADPSAASTTTKKTARTTAVLRTAAPEAASAKAAAKTVKPAAEVETASAGAGARAKGGAAVQVGAFSSAALAQQGFADAAKLGGLGSHARSVEKVSRDGKTFYRATLSGFGDKAAAKAFCIQLTAKGGRCLVKS